jgi:hypothetical protein
MAHRIFLVLALAASWLAAVSAVAQFPEHPRTLHSPAKVKGFIGGESHDTYGIKARRGQIMTVRSHGFLSATKNQAAVDNNAQFWVSTAPDFDGTGDVKFGQEFDNGKTWTRQNPKN